MKKKLTEMQDDINVFKGNKTLTEWQNKFTDNKCFSF